MTMILVVSTFIKIHIYVLLRIEIYKNFAIANTQHPTAFVKDGRQPQLLL